jgi:hypothetical protein
MGSLRVDVCGRLAIDHGAVVVRQADLPAATECLSREITRA